MSDVSIYNGSRPQITNFFLRFFAPDGTIAGEVRTAFIQADDGDVYSFDPVDGVIVPTGVAGVVMFSFEDIDETLSGATLKRSTPALPPTEGDSTRWTPTRQASKLKEVTGRAVPAYSSPVPNDPLPTTGIEVRTRIHPIGYALVRFLGKAVMGVDGVEYAIPWGESFLPASPGRHKVDVAFYMFKGPIPHAEASTMVTIPPNGNVRVRYSTPFWFWENDGKLKMIG
jgi:hypothetical protein